MFKTHYTNIILTIVNDIIVIYLLLEGSTNKYILMFLFAIFVYSSYDSINTLLKEELYIEEV